MTSSTVEALIRLGLHDSDCARHNEPAMPNGPCDCWLRTARDLYEQGYDSEDFERFVSRHAGRLLDIAEGVTALLPDTHQIEAQGSEARVTDAMVLAACRSLEPGTFKLGLEPRPHYGPSTTAHMRTSASRVRKMLEAAALTRPNPSLGSRDPYTVQSFADLRSQMESFERNHPDFPNYGDWPIPLPAGHWRAINAAMKTLSPPSLGTEGMRIADLQLALDFALNRLGAMEPGDSRAVSNEYVAMACIAAEQPDLAESRTILREALASISTPSGED